MLRKQSKSDNKKTGLNIVEPYAFALSLRAVKSFQPANIAPNAGLQLATMIEGIPIVIEVSTTPKTSGIVMSARPKAESSQISRIVEWVLFTELDLKPFYRLVSRDAKLRLLTGKLHGLKPIRPVSLFEMAVIAITEQQISLAAAYRLRSRFVERFGIPIEKLWVFPEPEILARAPLSDLKSCGLSQQKAQYIHDLASKIDHGTIDLDILKTLDDDKARETIMNLRGFGRWSADYILARGLARPDCVPVDDLGIRSVVGEYMGNGQRLSPIEVTEKLEPFRPYRGLLAFYLLANHRLNLKFDTNKL
jgi:DNA-3-methyladenine glycosylase II